MKRLAYLDWSRSMTYEHILRYIDEYWPRLIRNNPHDSETLIGLPHPYVTPAAQGMFQEMYYWDSYFTALGLVDTEHEQLIVDITENMRALYQRFGVIPNASRYYFTSRSQPPFFTRMIWLAYQVKAKRGDNDAKTFLADMMTVAEQEHETVWHGQTRRHDRLVYQGLSRYFDVNYLSELASCESGWDHSTRCDDRWLDHLPVDLNSILYAREHDFAEAAAIRGNSERATYWNERAGTRRQTIIELMWDEERGFFFDFDFANARRNPHPSLAGFYPLWAGLATEQQAARVVAEWLPQFEFPGGLVTTLEARQGRQWAYPNGWAPLQWIVVEGLERYRYQEEAQRLRQKWCDTCATVFERTGKLWEKYNVVEPNAHSEGGLYGDVEGFGWTNAVFATFARHEKAVTSNG